MPGEFVTKDSGARQEFSTGSRRDIAVGKGRYYQLPPFAIRRLAQLTERGEQKYGAFNYRRGQPVSRFLDSGIRHAFQYLEGDRSEDHLIACAWNILCAVEIQELIARGLRPAELDDVPVDPGGEA